MGERFLGGGAKDKSDRNGAKISTKAETRGLVRAVPRVRRSGAVRLGAEAGGLRLGENVLCSEGVRGFVDTPKTNHHHHLQSLGH